MRLRSGGLWPSILFHAVGNADDKGSWLIDSMHVCAYNWQVKFEWDSAKAASNKQKHDVDFADATTVLDDDLAITIREHAWGEERFVTLGKDAVSGCWLWSIPGAATSSGSSQPGKLRRASGSSTRVRL